jgi:tRNA dimethylallyltransferase
MDIATAKPNKAQLKSVRHHLIDVVGPDQPFSLANFQELAYRAIDETTARGKKPIVVGGTGLYIQALVDGLKIPHVPADRDLRETLDALAPDELVARLQKIDPDSAKAIPPQNKRRLMRAIEVTEKLGQPFSVIGRQFARRFDCLQIGLTAPREELYRLADDRVERWVRDGWVEEVKKLKKTYPENLPSMTSLGYRQIGMYFDGKISLDEAVRRTKFEIHGYIRRQVTWFRRDGRIYWYDTTQPTWREEIEKQVMTWYAEDDVAER